jgi:hypothetical protein
MPVFLRQLSSLDMAGTPYTFQPTTLVSSPSRIVRHPKVWLAMQLLSRQRGAGLESLKSLQLSGALFRVSRLQKYRLAQ